MEPDRYGRLSYRGLIAWPERLKREEPLLRRALEAAPSRRILDLGCGSGEHARFLASLGFEPTGLDASPAQVAAAREADPAGRYLHGSLTALGDLAEPPFGGAICLGNTLPHLTEEADVRRCFEGLAERLLPGGILLLQLLNYDRILDRGERAFPVMVRPGEGDGETVFLRLMTHGADGHITFTPATLRWRPGAEPPLELISAEEVKLRGWRRAEVEAFLEAAGFELRETLGSMTADPWTPASSDLVVVARRK
ncbi:bifunctional 2-polyprenyl-6-hydroxyphenol methylase/3-demethylubiquinol 3-O-methyltransferase UbiG [Geothrix sp. 21YS21S-4]|uniref:class I SAM-dependent methyltransferase n=1 Tax=Geothrix sp. 21YS21S-4 TaxID=3068889 RepID=UPI0027BA2F2A|nr:class I SAM-dependent methyltransferase [Geothrix sp. 21YS21S-4]